MIIANKLKHEYTIFVALTAYNDRYIKQTVDSALEKAKHPERLTFGISQQRIDNKFFDFGGYAQVKTIQTHYEAPLGLGIARNMTLALYDDEDFVFQIDAHMIFAQDWDDNLLTGYLEVYHDLQDDNIILTCHPPWWNKNDDGTYYFTPTYDELIPTVNYTPHVHIQECNIVELQMMKENKQIFGLFVALRADGDYEAFAKDWRGTRYKTFTTMEEARQWLSIGFSDSNFYPKYGGSASPSVNRKNYLEHFLFVAHYAFGTYSFFKDIVLDPLIQFGGEEPTMAMRGWTRGYRFFGIKGHILWHFNKNKNDDPEDRLANPGDPQLLSHYHKKQWDSLVRTKQILSGEILGYWGAPTAELLAAYEQAVNFNFKDFYATIDAQNKLIEKEHQ